MRLALGLVASVALFAVDPHWVSATGTATWANCQFASAPTASNNAQHCSLATANTNAAAGDTVYLRTGTYSTAVAPANSGTASQRITYSAASGETPNIQNVTTNLALLFINGKSYIRATGITFTNTITANLWARLQNGAHHIEVDHSAFVNTNGGRSSWFSISGCASSPGPTCSTWATHAWIHDNSFTITDGSGTNGCTDGGGDSLALGSFNTSLTTDAEDHHTIENNVFQGGPHDTINAYGHFNVYRNNTLRNEPWSSGCLTTWVKGTSSSTVTIPTSFPATVNLVVDTGLVFNNPSDPYRLVNHSGTYWGVTLVSQDFTKWFIGNMDVASGYNSTTGAMTLTIPDAAHTDGSGSSSSWYLSVTNPPIYTSNRAWNGKMSHRVFAVSDGYQENNNFSLIEGNRSGWSGNNQANDGGEAFTLAAGKSIVRYNGFFASVNPAFMFKYGFSDGFGSGAGGTNSRFYNNTVYQGGYGYPWGEFCGTNVCPWTGAGIAIYNSSLTGGSAVGNVLKNNIIYQNRRYTVSGFDVAKSNFNQWPLFGYNAPGGVGALNNWCTGPQTATDAGGNNGCSAGNGDPKFTNPDVSDPTQIATLPDFTLQASSPAINKGSALTTAVGAGSGSTTLTVADAMYFQDGTWGSDLARAGAGYGGTFQADWIAIGSVTNVVQIAGPINYAANTIPLATPATWANGDQVWLFQKSDGAIVLQGSAPDVGAYEFVSPASVNVTLGIPFVRSVTASTTSGTNTITITAQPAGEQQFDVGQVLQVQGVTGLLIVQSYTQSGNPATTSTTLTVSKADQTAFSAASTASGLTVRLIADSLDHASIRVWTTTAANACAAVWFDTASHADGSDYQYRSNETSCSSTTQAVDAIGLAPATKYYFRTNAKLTYGTDNTTACKNDACGATEWTITTPADTHDASTGKPPMPTLPEAVASWVTTPPSTAGYTVIAVPQFADGVVTGSITSGSTTLTVNTVPAGMVVNDWIVIAGTTCNFAGAPPCKITNIAGTTITLNQAATATVTGAAVSWSLLSIQERLFSGTNGYGTVFEFKQGYLGKFWPEGWRAGNDGLRIPGLPVDPAAASIDDPAHKWIVFRTAATPVTLPPPGVRTGPDWASALGGIQLQGTGSTQSALGAFVPSNQCENSMPAHHLRFENLAAIPQATDTGVTDPYPAAGIVSSSIGGCAAKYISIDRVYQTAPDINTRQLGISISGSQIAVTNSYIRAEFWQPSATTSAWMTEGPDGVAAFDGDHWLLSNTHLESYGKGFFVDVPTPQVRRGPEHVTLRRNHFYWADQYLLTSPSSNGKRYLVRHIGGEFKRGLKVLWEGNDFDGGWAGINQGNAINLSGTGTDFPVSSQVADVTIRYNKFHRISESFGVADHFVGTAPQMGSDIRRVYYGYNLSYNQNAWQRHLTPGPFFYGQALFSGGHDNIVERNTVYDTYGNLPTLGGYGEDRSEGQWTEKNVFHYNISARGLYGFGRQNTGLAPIPDSASSNESTGPTFDTAWGTTAVRLGAGGAVANYKLLNNLYICGSTQTGGAGGDPHLLLTDVDIDSATCNTYSGRFGTLTGTNGFIVSPATKAGRTALVQWVDPLNGNFRYQAGSPYTAYGVDAAALDQKLGLITNINLISVDPVGVNGCTGTAGTYCATVGATVPDAGTSCYVAHGPPASGASSWIWTAANTQNATNRAFVIPGLSAGQRDFHAYCADAPPAAVATLTLTPPAGPTQGGTITSGAARTTGKTLRR